MCPLSFLCLPNSLFLLCSLCWPSCVCLLYSLLWLCSVYMCPLRSYSVLRVLRVHCVPCVCCVTKHKDHSGHRELIKHEEVRADNIENSCTKHKEHSTSIDTQNPPNTRSTADTDNSPMQHKELSGHMQRTHQRQGTFTVDICTQNSQNTKLVNIQNSNLSLIKTIL